jgi:polyisoprenoid-binding protein YceI
MGQRPGRTHPDHVRRPVVIPTLRSGRRPRNVLCWTKFVPERRTPVRLFPRAPGAAATHWQYPRTNRGRKGTTLTGSATRSWQGITIPAPGTYLLDQAHKRIGFLARHMMVSPVRGEFGQATARIVVGEDPLTSSVTATIQAASISTGTPDRDVHLKSPDFLDVERYPTLEYRSTGIKWQGNDDPIFLWARLRSHRLGGRTEAHIPQQSTRTAGRFVLTGELTVKGITRPVDLQVEFGGARRDPYGQDIFGFSATAEIDRADYGLVWNVALESGGVLVAKKVRIELAGEAIRQA